MNGTLSGETGGGAADSQQGFVNGVFRRVASRYDVMNDLMSGGLHRLWKDALVDWLAPSSTRPMHLLDVAGGTGDIAERFLGAAGPASSAVICDISAEMLIEGQQRHRNLVRAGELQFVQGNAEALPFPARRFSAYTIAFGIRNVPNIPRALEEAHRVLKPGGRFLCLEFSQVDLPLLDRAYDAYADRVIPAMGRIVAGDAEPYRYLIDSIRKFPHQKAFAGMIEAAGFARVQYRNLSGGIAALHSGIKA